jgi:hypothetical protein
LRPVACDGARSSGDPEAGIEGKKLKLHETIEHTGGEYAPQAAALDDQCCPLRLTKHPWIGEQVHVTRYRGSTGLAWVAAAWLSVGATADLRAQASRLDVSAKELPRPFGDAKSPPEPSRIASSRREGVKF